MPRGDGTGPRGQGAGTGRGMGRGGAGGGQGSGGRGQRGGFASGSGGYRVSPNGGVKATHQLGTPLPKKRSTAMYDVTVDEKKCVGCGECMEICPVHVYEIQDEKSVPVNAEECLGCESCLEVCEAEAITVTEI